MWQAESVGHLLAAHGRLILCDCALLFFQELNALGESQIRGHGAEITKDLGRLDINPLEQEDLAGESEVHASNSPVAAVDIGLINKKMAATIEMAKNAPSESHLLEKISIDLGDVQFLRVDQDRPLHADQNLLYVCGRIVFWIGTKLESQELDRPACPPPVCRFPFRRIHKEKRRATLSG